MYNLPKKEMVNYRVEQSEEWQIYGSNFDLIKVSIRKNGVENEKVGSRSYIGLPTYFPCYLRNTMQPLEEFGYGNYFKEMKTYGILK